MLTVLQFVASLSRSLSFVSDKRNYHIGATST